MLIDFGMTDEEDLLIKGALTRKIKVGEAMHNHNPGTAQERDWKLNIKTVRMWPSNLLFIVAYFINFKLEFLSIGSTK